MAKHHAMVNNLPSSTTNRLRTAEGRRDAFVDDDPALGPFFQGSWSRPSRCEVAPCLLVMSAPKANVAHASEPRECTRRSSFTLSLRLLLGSNKTLGAVARYSAQLLYFRGARSK